MVALVCIRSGNTPSSRGHTGSDVSMLFVLEVHRKKRKKN
jgi:hypothetical protein